MALSKAKAKAIVAVRRRRKALQEADEALVGRVMSLVKVPAPIAGDPGRDAPEMSEILDRVIPLLPETKIQQTTIVEKIKEEQIEDIVQLMLDAKIPEIEKSLRPKVELIREEIDPEKLEGFVSKEDFDKALIRIQDAITYHSGGGSPPDTTALINLIEADEETNIVIVEDLSITKINIVHATVANSTVQLPALSPNYIVWVEDAVLGGGNITISREG